MLKSRILKILLCTSAVVPFIVVLLTSYYNNWITPFYQSDLSGSLFAMFEKKILHKVIHLYSLTYNEPGYARGPLELNNVFLTILPSIALFYSNNILAPLSILKLIVLTIAFASMCASTYYLTSRLTSRGNIILSILLGLLYAFSPLFMIFYFIPDLMFSYAILPLVLTPFISNLITGQLDKKILIFTFIVLLALHPHILIFTVLLISPIYTIDLLSTYLRQIPIRKKLKNAIIVMVLLTVVLVVKYYITYLFGSPIEAPMDVLIYERLSHYGEFRILSLSSFVELLGGLNVDGLVAYNQYAKFSGVDYMGLHAKLYVALTAIVIWLLVLMGFQSGKIHIREVSLVTLLVAIMAWLIYNTLLWLLQNYWLVERLSPIPLLGKAATAFIYTLRDPGRISSVVLAFALLALGPILNSFSRKRHFYVKICTLLSIFVIVLVSLNMFYFNFSTIFVHYKLSERPGWHEWSPQTYTDIITSLGNIYGYYNATIIDHSVSEPRLMHIGQTLHNDFNHYSYFVNSPSLAEMTKDLAPVVWITSVDSKKETESLFYRGIGALLYNYDKGLSVFLLDKPAIRIWLWVPNNLCSLLQEYRNLTIKINITNVVSPAIIKSEQLPKIIEELKTINGSTNFVLETWAKISDFGKNRNQIILSIGNLWNNGSLALLYGWGNDFYFSLGERNTATLNAIVPQWHLINHIVVEFDKGTMSIYVNGKLLAKKFISKERAYLHFNGTNIKYNEMSHGIALGINIFKGKPESLKFTYKVIDSKVIDGMLLGNIKLRIETNYCRDLWIPLNIPLYSGNFNSLEMSLESLNDKFLQTSIILKDINVSFETYVFVERVYINGVSKCEDYKPIVIQGGANTISVASSLLSAFKKKGAECILPVAAIPLSETAGYSIVRAVDIALLYYSTLKGENSSSISFYKYYTPSNGLYIRGFGLRYYWSLPFLTYISSGIYGEYNDVPYSLVISRTRSGAVLELNTNGLKPGEYYVFADMTLQGRGNISIVLLDNKSRMLASKSVYVNTYIPLHLFVNVGKIDISGSEERIVFKVIKSKEMIVALNNVFFSRSDLFQSMAKHRFPSSYIYIIPLVPLVQLINVLNDNVSINNVYWYDYASLLMDDARALHVTDGGSITLPPIKLTNTTYDIYIHLVPPIPSGGIIELNITTKSNSRIFNYSITESITEDRWVKIGSIELRTPSIITLSIKMLKGYVNIDAIALVPEKFIDTLRNESNYLLIKKYYKYSRPDIKMHALETLNGYILLPIDYFKPHGEVQSPWTLIDKKWFFISLIFTIYDIFMALSVILLMIFFTIEYQTKKRT